MSSSSFLVKDGENVPSVAWQNDSICEHLVECFLCNVRSMWKLLPTNSNLKRHKEESPSARALRSKITAPLEI